MTSSNAKISKWQVSLFCLGREHLAFFSKYCPFAFVTVILFAHLHTSLWHKPTNQWSTIYLEYLGYQGIPLDLEGGGRDDFIQVLSIFLLPLGAVIVFLTVPCTNLPVWHKCLTQCLATFDIYSVMEGHMEVARYMSGTYLALDVVRRANFQNGLIYFFLRVPQSYLALSSSKSSCSLNIRTVWGH